jgi:hypothetical protein
MEKKYRIYTHDGDGYANNQAYCVQYAKRMGIRPDQYEIRQLEADNYSQTAALYVTEAAKRKIDQKREK